MFEQPEQKNKVELTWDGVHEKRAEVMREMKDLLEQSPVVKAFKLAKELGEQEKENADEHGDLILVDGKVGKTNRFDVSSHFGKSLGDHPDVLLYKDVLKQLGE
jgi:phosphoribosylanthranilate isomerase